MSEEIHAIMIYSTGMTIIMPSFKIAETYAEMLAEDLRSMGYNVKETTREGKKAYVIENKEAILVW